MSNVVTLSDSTAHARAVKARLWNPTGGRASSEIDVISDPEKRRRLQAQADSFLEARNAQQDFERAKAAGELLLKALQERAHVLAIARQIAEEEPPPPPTILDVLRAVARYTGIPSLDIQSARLTQNVVRPRQIAMYLARELTLYSLPAIGRRLGGRDHTTILHGHRKIKRLIEGGDVRLAADVDNIKWELGIR
jgi:chromosomal replication initiation ATPase DnaA